MKYNPSSPSRGPIDLFEAEDAVLLAAGATAIAPSARLFDRIAQTTASVPRFERFADTVGTLLDVGHAEALKLLARLDDGGAWEPGLFPGMVLQHAEGGARVTNAVTGFVRLVEGAVFPEHEHLGTERILVIQGRCRDGDAIYGPGDYVEMAAGTSHSFTVCPGPDFVYLAVVQEGLRLGGVVIGPDDPRG